ncbi:MAG: helix-turn-helix domain-containing protein, partial [Gammaproteobacteria bacterium]
SSRDNADPPLPEDMRAYVEDLERRIVARSLREHGYHQGRAAAAIGLTYHQFRNYLRKFGIPSRPPAGGADDTA